MVYDIIRKNVTTTVLVPGVTLCVNYLLSDNDFGSSGERSDGCARTIRTIVYFSSVSRNIVAHVINGGGRFQTGRIPNAATCTYIAGITVSIRG